jgi:hypothetical protein
MSRGSYTTECDIELKPMLWWHNRGVTLKVGCPATEIDVGRREIEIANDESVSFSRLGIRAAAVECALSGSSHPANLPLKRRERHRSSFSSTFSAPHRRGDRIAWLLPVMAHRVISLLRSNRVALGAKQTLSSVSAPIYAFERVPSRSTPSSTSRRLRSKLRKLVTVQGSLGSPIFLKKCRVLNQA